MSDWNPEKYLQFKRQRTQPAKDLAARLLDFSPASAVDIGCGPGNSTAVLKELFPSAKLIGIDRSESMIARAREKYADISFEVCSAHELRGKFDLIFSNACFQWIPGHEELIPALMGKLNHGGYLAVQMPMNQEEPLFQLIKETVSQPKWNFENSNLEKNDVLSPQKYFDILSCCASSFDMWESVYYHAMPSHQQLIEWVEGTRLRPYLNVLSDENKFLLKEELLEKTKKAYPFTDSGEVILRFRRLFFTAQK